MSTPELKPCPFCGFTPERIRRNVMCGNETCPMSELERRVEELTEYGENWRKQACEEGNKHFNETLAHAKTKTELSQLRAEVERLTKERDEAREKAENDSDDLWLCAIARYWDLTFAKLWDDRDGESREEAISHNVAAIFQEIDTLRAQLAEREEDRWQPIETAPKDGTPIIATNTEAGGSWIAIYKPILPSGYKPEMPWMSYLLNHDHIPNKKASIMPTLWQPLPTIRAARAQPEDGK